MKLFIVGVLALGFARALLAGEIQDAAKAGDLARVQAMVKATPALVNARDRGTTPLHEAARAGHIEVVRFLIEQGANPNVNDSTTTTPLKLALGYHRGDVAEYLRQHGALERIESPRPVIITAPAATREGERPREPKQIEPERATAREDARPPAPTKALPPNIVAAPTNKVPSVQDMLPVIYPIHEAARLGEVDQIKMLFKSFPDVIEATDEKGRTPLYMAAANRQIAAAQALLGLGAKVSARTDIGQTALHAAARNGDVRMVQLLLTNHANVNARDTFDRTPLLAATQPTEKDDLEGLNEAAVRERFKSPQRKAERAAEQQEQLSVVKVLIANGADLNARSRAGANALSQSVWLLNDAIVDLLLRSGVDPNVPDPATQVTALHVAAGRGVTNIITLLLKAKASVNAPDVRRETPLGYALHQGHPEAATLLRQHGANIGPQRQLNAVEQSLTDFFRRTDAALQRASPGEKTQTILAMTPTKADTEQMFPKHGAAAWKVVDVMRREIKQKFQKPVADADQGKEIWRILPEAPSPLAMDWVDRGWLNRQLPMLSLAVDRVGKTSRPGDYCFVNQHWVLLPPLRSILLVAQAAQQR